MIKVLIVDDEEWIRLGLREQVDWNSLGLEIIGEAQNGAVALEIIEKELPEIVITDIRMPKVDGITLMENINSKYSDILIIIISGYSEFEYARKAISFSAFDYILKPIEEVELEKTLIRAVNKLKKDENRKFGIISLKAELSESSRLVKDKILTNLVTGNESGYNEALRYFDKIGTGFQWSRMVVLVFKAANFDEVTAVVYDNDAGLAGFALTNVVSELIGDHADSILFLNHAKQNELIIIKGFNTDEYHMITEDIYAVCKNIIDIVREYMDFKLYTGVGGEFTSLKDAPNSYNQALEAAAYAGMLHDTRIIHIDEVSSRNEYFIYPDDKEKALLYYVENGYKSQACDLIERLFEEMGGSKTAIHQSIRNTILELTISISKMLKMYNCIMEELIQERNFADKIMNELFTASELKEWFKSTVIEVMDMIAGKRKSRSPRMIKQIADYVAANYDKDINLSSVSERFYINPAYLSRKFKNEIGKNFNNYLNKIRMDAAIKLLKDDSLKMNDISIMVGFENVNYFLKRFKENFNCTPTEYRKKYF